MNVRLRRRSWPPLGQRTTMETQETYDVWVRQMIDRHCPALFDAIEFKEYNGITYTVALRNDPRGDNYCITLSTYGHELTSACKALHCHFDQFESDDHEEEFLNAINWINNLMGDNIVIFTKMSGDRVVSAMAAEPAYKVAPSEGERVEVFSFSGKLDRTIK